VTRQKVAIRKASSVVVSLILVFIASGAYASIEYTVKKGDTLSGISRKYRVSVKAVQGVNGISPKKLKPGTKITVPSKKKTGRSNTKHGSHGKAIAAMQKPCDLDTNNHVKLATQLSGNLYHTVRKGETFFSIGKKYSIGSAELMELNNLKSTRVKKGQRLLVRQVGPKTYIVKRGDTIGRIAKKFDMDVDDLMALNEMETASVTVGQKLYLEEKVDATTAEAYTKMQSQKFEEEIKQVSESEEFKAKDSPNKLITFAKKMINIPYKFGGNSILGIDCSAYVKKVYGLLDVELPRTAREQFNTGETVEKDELSIGDLVFFRTYASFPSHVGIYLGNDLFIHASSRGKKVTIDSLETPYYLKRFIGGKRLLTEGDQEKDQQS
jgi:peptidoglycan DL-endopeptidase LytE